MTRPKTAEMVELMTLDEQVSLLAGGNFWETVAIDRLGIPSIKVTDGPNGARGAGSFSAGVKAASFPVGISLASSWDTELIGEIATALAEEARTKGGRVVLAPTVNIHRSPLGGRNFESFSEDPWLAGQLGAAYVSGLQNAGVGATVKHFAGNESEFERMTIDSQIDERALREIYLRPFEIAVRKGRPWVVMAAYNRLNGTYAGENQRLLTEILRREWGFDGMVMSDWTGTRSTAAAVNAGLDLEMPGPTKWRGRKLVDAVLRGEANRTAVAASAGQVLDLVDRSGGFTGPATSEERAVDDPRHRGLIRRAGASGIVLLTNDGVLPLKRGELNSIAVLGPNAAVAQIMGGGSSQINAHYRISPVEGITQVAGPGIEVTTAPGCGNNRMVAPLAGPVRLDYFANVTNSDSPVLSQQRDGADIMWLGHAGPGVDFSRFSVRLTADYHADKAGRHDIGVVSSGPVRVLMNDEPVLDKWADWAPGGEYFGLASIEYRASMAMESGRTYRVVAEMRTPDVHAEVGLKAFRLGIEPPPADEDLDEAVRLAESADVAIVCVGLNGEWDTEGMDRPSMDLPGRQDELINRVSKANAKTIAVLQSGGALTMPWLGNVSAVLQAWYPGQECGNAIADVLFGDVTPSGKLPQTFPRAHANNPAALSYPGGRGAVQYTESIYAGYRGYDAREIAPLFPFGYGLSYTTFAYRPIRLSAPLVLPGDALSAEVEITNTGDCSGAEIVQLYVHDPVSELPRPPRELKAFARLELAAGESATARFNLDMRSFAYFDDRRDAWVADAGQFEIQIGASSADIRSIATVELAEEWVESARDAWRSAHL